MSTHRIPEFADTTTPEQHFEESTRGLLDSEFSCDEPRPSAGIAGAVALILAGLLLGAVFYGVVRGFEWLCGVAK